jgi:hypothetical protein
MLPPIGAFVTLQYLSRWQNRVENERAEAKRTSTTDSGTGRPHVEKRIHARREEEKKEDGIKMELKKTVEDVRKE